ncbi:MAG: hypothetical protein MUP47_02090 [Phycisphaerae bacterium]|nr:hypothetical protein [Phycisphaerae bacterium]
MPPLPFLATSALYPLEVGKRDVTLRAELELRMLDAACPAIGVLAALDQGWQELTINGKEAYLPAVDGFLRFLPPGEGVYVIAAKVPLGRPGRRGKTVQLAVLETARTTVAFDSPTAWEVLIDPGERQLPSSAGSSTHGRLALPRLDTPTVHVMVNYYAPPQGRYGPGGRAARAFSGTLRLGEECTQMAVEQAQPTAPSPEQQAQALQQVADVRAEAEGRATGATPIKVHLPIEGKLFKLEKILATPGDELYFDVEYANWPKGP